MPLLHLLARHWYTARGLPLLTTSSTVSLKNISAVESLLRLHPNCPVMVWNLIVKHGYRYFVNDIRYTNFFLNMIWWSYSLTGIRSVTQAFSGIQYHFDCGFGNG
jgi:hypothetical protein